MDLTDLAGATRVVKSLNLDWDGDGFVEFTVVVESLVKRSFEENLDDLLRRLTKILRRIPS